MFLKGLKLTNFRNFDNLDISFNKNINIIVGENALGKTNIIESIYVLGLTKTFRFAKDKDLVKFDKNYYQIHGKLERNDFVDNIKLTFDGTLKKMQINEEKISKVSDFISKLNVVVFSPDDLELIKGSPEIRRKFLNLEISQLFPSYCKLMSEYNSLLKMRNDYLKKMKFNDKVDMNYFYVLENYFIEKAIQIYKIRNKFLSKLTFISKDLYMKTMEKEGFCLKYSTTPHIELFEDEYIREQLKKSFSNKLKDEIRLGSTMVGPHKDDFIFYLNEQNIKITGSQSQQKLAVLVLKLAELELFKQQLNEYPILLLDDIFSELDDSRKNNVLSYLKLNIQTFITTTDIENISDDIKINANLINIEELI